VAIVEDQISPTATPVGDANAERLTGDADAAHTTDDSDAAPVVRLAPRHWIGGALEPVPVAVARVARPVIESHGLELVGTELTRDGARTVLWIYIDRPEGGVNIDDCARVSPEVSAALDVDDPLPEASYEMRVSSPGVDRPMMNDADFNRFAGREVVLSLATPLAGRRKFTGKIIAAEEAVTVLCADGEHAVPLAAIQKARLRYEDIDIGKRARKR
jgi:ribosome maturation factor RimP